MNKKIIALPDGYTLRAPRDEDAEAIAELANDDRAEFTNERLFTAKTVKADWNSPRFDRERSVCVVEDPQGRIVGSIKLWDTDSPPVFMWAPGMVHPTARGIGIGQALLAWVEVRARESIERCPEDARVSILVTAYQQNERAARLFSRRGYQQIRTDWRMQIDLDHDLPEPVWPEGITLSTYQHPEMLEAVFQADKDAFRDHHGFVDGDDAEELADWKHWIETEPNFDSNYWQVAMDGDRVAGVCLAFREFRGDKQRGYIDSLAVRPAYRRKGLGLALLQDAFRRLQEAGRSACVLAVDSGSLTGAQRLYERAGMRTVLTWHMYEYELRPGIDLVRK
jgi:mycothiol synthase